MTTADSNTSNARAQASYVEDTVPLLVGGWIFGVMMVVVCLCLDGIALGMIQWLVVGDEPQFWPNGAVIAAGVSAVVISIAVGVWLFSQRRWIGTKTDPSNFHLVRRKRRSFAIGSLVGYVMFTPAVWFLLLALANSTAFSAQAS
jgi:hypothetical protein